MLICFYIIFNHSFVTTKMLNCWKAFWNIKNWNSIPSKYQRIVVPVIPQQIKISPQQQFLFYAVLTIYSYPNIMNFTDG